MIIRLNKPRFRSQVAFFDFDWTMVCPKDGRTFPKNIDDWKWWRPSVPEVIKSYYDKGFGIYIVTNQSKKWKEEQIKNVISQLEIPVTICIAWEKETQYKPSLYLYQEAFTSEQQEKIKKNKSFMCGDALGRPNDHSDCDKKFAEAIGIKCFSPEEKFLVPKQLTHATITPSSSQEVIVMVGYPGSGKTTISNDIFDKAGYFIAHGDDLKTSAKMLKAAKTALQEGKSVVFDATNPTIEKRKEYIDFANKNNIATRCIWVATSFEESLTRNNTREKPVPKIVFNVYRKRFQEPTKEEGFDDVLKI